MAATYPGSSNVFVKAHNKLVVDFARNIARFPVNRYTQVVPVRKIAGYWLQMTIEEAGRIQNTDLSEFVWEDGQEAPEGLEGKESHEFKPYSCIRYCYPVMLGDLTTDQADWDILAQNTSIKSRQAMTARTQLAITALTTTSNWDSSHVIDVTTDVTGNLGSTTGNWRQSTTARQDIKRSLIYASEKILDDTLAGIDLDDLMLVINSELAGVLAQSQELVDYIKGSPEALAQVRGELPNRNAHYGIPEKLYGFPVVVEDTRKVTTKKGATTSRSQVLPTATPIMVARPGEIEGIEGPNFSTCVCHAFEEMAVETIRDADNRRTKTRVVENLTYNLVAPASGVLFQAAA